MCFWYSTAVISWLRKRKRVCVLRNRMWSICCAVFGKWPCFVILHTLYKYTWGHIIYFINECVLHETRDEVTSDDLCGSKSNFMSMPFAKYARMTIVSDSAIAEGLFAFARAYNKFHIYRTLFIYGTTCAFENININSLGFIEKRIIIFICISWEMKIILANLIASSDWFSNISINQNHK